VLAVCAALALGGGAGAAMAQSDAPAAQQVVGSDAGAAGKGDHWGDGRAVRDPRKAPARGEPYNWRQMGFGALIMLVMLAFVVWLVRRTKGTPSGTKRRQTRKS